MNELIVRRFDYLKSPYCTWTLTNSQGGSFSNSGKQTSIASAIRHALYNCKGVSLTVAKVYSVDYDGNETLIDTLTVFQTLLTLID